MSYEDDRVRRWREETSEQRLASKPYIKRDIGRGLAVEEDDGVKALGTGLVDGDSRSLLASHLGATCTHNQSRSQKSGIVTRWRKSLFLFLGEHARGKGRKDGDVIHVRSGGDLDRDGVAPLGLVEKAHAFGDFGLLDEGSAVGLSVLDDESRGDVGPRLALVIHHLNGEQRSKISGSAPPAKGDMRERGRGCWLARGA
jgi:hypothetical protein